MDVEYFSKNGRTYFVSEKRRKEARSGVETTGEYLYVPPASKWPPFGQPDPLKEGSFAHARARRALVSNLTALTRASGADGSTYGIGRPTMGSDPEIFLARDDGSLINAFDVLPDKKTGMKYAHNSHMNYFWDGFQAEFAPLHAMCLVQHCEYIQNTMWNMLKAARAKEPKATLSASDVVQVPEETLNKVSDQHAALGCDPSINIYGTTSHIPADPRKLPWRFAGGHIHFGSDYLAKHKDPSYTAAKIVADLDKVLAVWSVGVFAKLEKAKVRRQFYGLAGEFRLPVHGLEYRVLSNAWLSHPSIYYITFDLARAVFQASRLGLMEFWNADHETVQQIVNHYDVELARKSLKLNEKMFKWLTQAANTSFAVYKVSLKKEPMDFANAAFALAQEGIESQIQKPEDIVENWNLDKFHPEVYSTFVSGKTWANHVIQLGKS